MELVSRLDLWFAEKLHGLRYGEDTRAYVAGVLANFKTTSDRDLSDKSVVLAFYDARLTGEFAAYQRIGDWVLWTSAVHPEHFAENRKIVQDLGSLSYYTCNRIMMGKWPIYKELGDHLPQIAFETKVILDTTHLDLLNKS